MTNERDRLEDLNIEEAVGRTGPPDLTDRILKAAEQRELEEAKTPISGRHSVPRDIRPARGRRMTAHVPKKNWQGVGFVGVFVLLFAVGLVAFMVLNEDDSTVTVDPQETAEDEPESGQPTETPEAEEQPEIEPDPEPEPAPEQKPQSEPEPEPEQPEESVEDPAPESPEPEIKKPDSVIEEPEPDTPPEEAQPDPQPEVRPVPPKPDDVVEDPQPEEDKTEARPAPTGYVVASLPIPADRSDAHVFSRQYRVRNLDDSKWVGANEEGAAGIERDEENGVLWIYEGTRMKVGTADLALSNGALLHIDGEVRLYGHAQGMRVEIEEDDLYLDNLGAPTPVRVTKGELELVVDQGAALFETTSSKINVFCLEGEVRFGAVAIPKGHLASLSDRGLSDIEEAPKGAYRHVLLNSLPQRHIGIEEFDDGPDNGMIRGAIESRTAVELDRKIDSNVGVERGTDATVSFQFDGDHLVMPGEVVRIRYRHKGAEKLILQFWNPEKADNFGKDLPAQAKDEWHVIEIRMSDLLDRESARVKLPEGALLTSVGLHAVGAEVELEVDWIELVRDPQYGE